MQIKYERRLHSTALLEKYNLKLSTYPASLTTFTFSPTNFNYKTNAEIVCKYQFFPYIFGWFMLWHECKPIGTLAIRIFPDFRIGLE